MDVLAVVGLGAAGAVGAFVVVAWEVRKARRRSIATFHGGGYVRPEVTSIPVIDPTLREHIIYPNHPLYARVVAAMRGRDIDTLDLTPYRLTDTDAADAMPPPPNLGGEGNPPYQGPNYVHADEVAADMKAVQHEYVPGQTPWAYLYENGIPLGTEVRIVGGSFEGERGVVRERFRDERQTRYYGVKLLTGRHKDEKGVFVAPENHLAL